MSGRAAAVGATAHIEDSAFLQQSHPLFDVERFLQQSPSLTRKSRNRCAASPGADVERRVWYERPWAVPAAPATPSTPDPSTHRPERRIVGPSTKPPNRCAHAHTKAPTCARTHRRATTHTQPCVHRRTLRPRARMHTRRVSGGMRRDRILKTRGSSFRCGCGWGEPSPGADVGSNAAPSARR